MTNTQKQGPYHVLSAIQPINSSDNDDKQKQSRVTSKDQLVIKIHRFLELGGNEEDNTETLGNRPDITIQEGKNMEIVNILQSSKMGFNQQENETQRDSE